ncbi:cytochrome P450 [Streptomyces chrestomyceticus]|uniref:cytochrome P450 n=1 Tax=Streptomyces chrestomyceticus TaxID=68185 RepID=UPI00340825DE
MLYEFARRPEWQRRLADELGAVNPAAFRTAPPSAAPVTHRFVKEVLRQWSPPLLLVRRSTVPFDLGKTRLAPGDRYLLSPRMMHRDGRVRNGPDLFDPDRILPGASHGPADRTCYVPFGWAPKKCVGANVAIVQLMALCHLLCTRYRLAVHRPDEVTMALRFAPAPENFRRRPALGQLHGPHGAAVRAARGLLPGTRLQEAGGPGPRRTKDVEGFVRRGAGVLRPGRGAFSRSVRPRACRGGGRSGRSGR